jgi:hypothetical protein
VKFVMGLIATMAALVLGLLIASARTSSDQQVGQLKARLATSFYLLVAGFSGVRIRPNVAEMWDPALDGGLQLPDGAR